MRSVYQVLWCTYYFSHAGIRCTLCSIPVLPVSLGLPDTQSCIAMKKKKCFGRHHWGVIKFLKIWITIHVFLIISITGVWLYMVCMFGDVDNSGGRATGSLSLFRYCLVLIWTAESLWDTSLYVDLTIPNVLTFSCEWVSCLTVVKRWCLCRGYTTTIFTHLMSCQIFISLL